MSLTNTKGQGELREPLVEELVPLGFAPLKPKLPDLPTVGKSFFYKGPGSYLHRLEPSQPSYIFFDPALNLPPHLISIQDFVSPPSTPPPSDDVSNKDSTSTTTSSCVKSEHSATSTNSSCSTPKQSKLSSKPCLKKEPILSMAKKHFDHVDKDFETVKAIKDKISLNDADFKRLSKVIAEFIGQNEDECTKVPRSWKKQNWKDLCSKFVEDDGHGQEFWNQEREGFTSSDDLLYPTDKISIAFLVCMILRRECAKHFSNAKRKSVADEEGNADSPTAKKAKATPKSASKVAKEAKDDATNQSTTKKRAPAKKKKAAAPKTTERVADDESGSDEEDHVARPNPFEAAQHANDNPAFARENLIGKPGIPPPEERAVEPMVEAPQIMTETNVTNDLFTVSGIPPAPRADGLDPEDYVAHDQVQGSGTPHVIHQSVEFPDQDHGMLSAGTQEGHLDGVEESDTEMLDQANNGHTSHAITDASGEFTLSSPTWDPSSPLDSPTSPLSSAQYNHVNNGSRTPNWNTEPKDTNGVPISAHISKHQGSLSTPRQAPVVSSPATEGSASTSATAPMIMTFGVTVPGTSKPHYVMQRPVTTPFMHLYGQIISKLNATSVGPLIVDAKTANLSWSHCHQVVGIGLENTEGLWRVAVRHILEAMKAVGQDTDGEIVDLIFS